MVAAAAGCTDGMLKIHDRQKQKSTDVPPTWI